MPTYEYVCEACEHEFELFQSITASPKRKCPQCGRLKLRRLIGPGAAIVFKGSGFYQTDYRSDSYKKAAARDNKSDAGTASEKKTSEKTSEKSASQSTVGAGSAAGAGGDS
jgi:putative FmdB family regulatory protein